MPRQRHKTLGDLARENLRESIAAAKANRGKPRQKPADPQSPAKGKAYDKAASLQDIFSDLFDPENLKGMPAFQRGMVLSLVPRYLRAITGNRSIEAYLHDYRFAGSGKLLILVKTGHTALSQELRMCSEQLRQRINAKMKDEILTQIIVR